jgi:hypothetical protein
MFIIITGNPADGFNYWGPYPTAEDASRTADRIFRSCDWWITNISDPEEKI